MYNNNYIIKEENKNYKGPLPPHRNSEAKTLARAPGYFRNPDFSRPTSFFRIRVCVTVCGAFSEIFVVMSLSATPFLFLRWKKSAFSHFLLEQ